MVEPKKIEKINLATCAADGKKRMIMKVYLEYPSFLHKRHNDYPLAAEKIMKVNKEICLPIAKLSATSMESILGKYLRLYQLWAKKRSMSCIAETCNYICLWD